MARGRPRKVDPNAALETAIELFWEKGYEGTSMNDLVAATGMAKPGLYATFGDKEAFYAKALTHYVERGWPLLDDLARSDAPIDVVLRGYLDGIAAAAGDRHAPGIDERLQRRQCEVRRSRENESGHSATAAWRRSFASFLRMRCRLVSER